MDGRPDADPHQHIGSHLAHGGEHLILGVVQPLGGGEGGGLQVDAADLPRRLPDEVLDLVLHPQPLDDAAADDRQHQPHRHIGHRDAAAKDAGQQHQRPQIDQRRGDEKRKAHPQRDARAGESHKQRDG